MPSNDDPSVRTALTDISSEFAALLADTDMIQFRPGNALDASLIRARHGSHESRFASAVPDTPGSATG